MLRAAMQDAISHLLKEFSWNPFFIEYYWPQNEYRVRMILSDTLRYCPPPARIFDVGCGNGFLCYLYSRLGYQVTATDAAEVAERPALFEKRDIKFFYSNLNEPQPFAALNGDKFDLVVIGEVIEHILNHPLGLMRSIAEVTEPSGYLILTTPNPATLINALRLIRGNFKMWGTEQFIEQPKIKDGHITDIGDVHFHEYTTGDLKHLLSKSGFTVKRVSYCAMGSPKVEPRTKRLVKSLLKPLASKRLLSSDQYILAQRT